MKTLKLFLEDFKKDEKELQSGSQISNIDLAHSLALTTCSFEFECYLERPDPVNKDRVKDFLQAYSRFAVQIRKMFKTKNVEVAAAYHGIPTAFKIDHPDYWFVEYDGSLNDLPYENYVPVEIISPWIPAKDAAAFIEKFKTEVFDFFNGKTNSSTGFHVNLRTKNAIANPLKLLLLFDQKAELKKFKRQDNTFTVPHDLNTLLSKYGLMKKHYDLTKPEQLAQVTSHLLDAIPREKRFAINVKDYMFNTGKGRLEFRIIGDDYLDSLYKKTISSVNRFIMLMASATDDKAHVKELDNKFKKFTADYKVLFKNKELSKYEINDQVQLTRKRLPSDIEDLIKRRGGNFVISYLKDLHYYTDESWPEGEDLIAKDLTYAIDYAQTTAKEFRKGEDIIATDAKASYIYAATCINTRFKKGEAAILKNPDIALQYINNVLRKRWVEAEDTIAKEFNAADCYRYALNIIKGRFPQAEKKIAKQETYALLYAKNVIKGPFPEAEDIIATDGVTAFMYATQILNAPFPKAEKVIREIYNSEYDKFLKGLK